MWILTVTVAERELEGVSAEFYELGTAGIREIPLPDARVKLEAWFEDRFEWPGGEWAEAPEGDWSERWRDVYEPVLVGQRIFLVPEWSDAGTPEGRVRLEVHPAQASGSGYHAPTQLALRALEETLRAGDRFLDVGTGSGILTKAAGLLGCGAAFACDIDDTTLVEARVSAPFAGLFVGSARAVRTGSVDVVAANLNAQSLLSLRDDLPRVLAAGGRLILSGFKERRLAALREAFGGQAQRQYEQDDWRCLVIDV